LIHSKPVARIICVLALLALLVVGLPGGAVAGPPGVAGPGAAIVSPATGGTVRLNAEAVVIIPAGALRGSSTAQVSIARVSNPPAAPPGYAIACAYEFTVDGGGYSFAAPVDLSITFDPALLREGQTPLVYMYDATRREWSMVPGSAVTGNTVTVSVDRFGLFAVMVGKEAPGAPQMPAFTDVPAGYWGAAAIQKLSTRGVVKGYPDGTFRPDATVTRAEFVTMLVKALGLSASQSGSAFKDVADNDWYRDSVNTAVSSGLVSGVGEGRFAPNTLITREQMAVMITRALGDKAPGAVGASVGGFSDRVQISSWAQYGMEVVVKAGIMNGMTPTRLEPRGNATRAQAIAVIDRMLAVMGR